MTSPPPKRLRVSILIDTLGDIGGAEPLAAQLVARLPPDRFSRSLVTYREHTPGTDEAQIQARAVAELREAGVEITELEGSGRRDLQAWRPFLKALRAGRVDVLHSHKFGPNLWASLFSRLAPVPVLVAHEHTWSYSGNPRRRLADRWVIATRADVMIAVSDADRDNMQRIEHIPRERIRVLANGIPSVSSLPPGTLRASLRLPEGTPIVGTVAALRPQKDLATLFAAMPAVLHRHPTARLVVLGDGPERASLEALVASLALEAYILMPGFRPDAARLAADFDVAVNSSTFEGSSLAIIEYMAAARAIVATDVGGNRALLDDARVGVVVSPGRSDNLAEAVTGLLGDEARRTALGQAAQARQRAEYDISVQAERLGHLYEELYARASSRTAASTA